MRPDPETGSPVGNEPPRQLNPRRTTPKTTEGINPADDSYR
jgi:hypothetical protein